MAFGMIYTWLTLTLVDGKDTGFVIFESDTELQEVCWKGLRYSDK